VSFGGHRPPLQPETGTAWHDKKRAEDKNSACVGFVTTL
jgi:hypothetical protein